MRATTGVGFVERDDICVMLRPGDVVRVVAVLELVVVLAERFWPGFCDDVPRDVFSVLFCLRGDKTDVLAVMPFSDVVARWGADFARDAAFPSRTAAWADPADINIHSANVRIFFISGKYVSKKMKIRASEMIGCFIIRFCSNSILTRHSFIIFVMNKSRLEAFSDGVFAVAITIMVLALTDPPGVTLGALRGLVPVFLSYLLSYIYIAIFWINHHHLLAATRRVNSAVLWANLHFLFWVSLIPFFTAWVDDNHVAPVPVAAYGVVLMMCFVAYRLLEILLIRAHDDNAAIVRALKPGRRENPSIISFIVAIAMAAVHPFISLAIYIIIALLWMRPHPRLEKIIGYADICDSEKAAGK